MRTSTAIALRRASNFLQKVKLICGNESCKEFIKLKAVIDGKASY